MQTAKTTVLKIIIILQKARIKVLKIRITVLECENCSADSERFSAEGWREILKVRNKLTEKTEMYAVMLH